MAKNIISRDITASLETGMLLVGFYGAYILSRRTPNPVKAVILYIFAVSVPLCFVGFWLNGAEWDRILGLWVGVRGSLAPPGGTHHYLGAVAALSTILALFYYRAWGLGLLSVALLTLSGARSDIFGILAVCAVFLVMRPVRRWISVRVATLGFALCGILVFGAIFLGHDALNESRFAAFFSEGGAQEVERYGLFTGREMLWRRNLELFRRHPLVGNPAKLVRGDVVVQDGQPLLITESGEVIHAGTESQFDYYFARDGIIGASQIVLYVAAFYYAAELGSIAGCMIVAFVFFSSIGSPILRHMYADTSILYVVAYFGVLNAPVAQQTKRNRTPRFPRSVPRSV